MCCRESVRENGRCSSVLKTMDDAKTRIMLVDDHPLIRAGFRNLLAGQSCEIVAEAGTAEEALELASAHRPALAIVDLVLPGRDGIDLTSQLVAEGVRVLVVSQFRDAATVNRALAAGANGYAPKTVGRSELLQAVATVARGEVWISPSTARGLVDTMRAPRSSVLTQRQLEVLQLIVDGNSTKQISRLLAVSVKTVETHRAQILERLGVKSVAVLVRYAIEHKLVR